MLAWVSELTIDLGMTVIQSAININPIDLYSAKYGQARLYISRP